MNQIIIYGSYDQDEYTNYYHLINNGEALIEYSEEIDGLFQQINDTKNEVKSSEIYIVQDENASKWDYLEMFQKYHFELRASSGKDTEQLCNIMNSALERNFKLDGDCEIEKLNILFYGNVIFENDCGKADETLRQAEEILKYGNGEEKTELARIIREKYERMNKHE